MKRNSKVAAIAVMVAAVSLTIISTNHVAKAQVAKPGATPIPIPTPPTNGYSQINNTYAVKFI